MGVPVERLAEKCDAIFWSHVDKTRPDGCWFWTASVQSAGYGQMVRWFRIDGVRHKVLLLAHRVAYVAVFGTIPDGLELDHLCRQRRCVNPISLGSGPAHHQRASGRALGTGGLTCQ